MATITLSRVPAAAVISRSASPLVSASSFFLSASAAELIRSPVSAAPTAVPQKGLEHHTFACSNFAEMLERLQQLAAAGVGNL